MPHTDPTFQEIYQNIVGTLRPSDQLGLVALILNDLTKEDVAAIDNSDTWSEQDLSSSLSFRSIWHRLPPSRTVMLLKCLLILQSLPETDLEEAAKKLEEFALPYFSTDKITKQQAQAVANLFTADSMFMRYSV